MHFHAFMASFESKRFIKTDGIWTFFVGGQLQYMGVTLLCSLNGPLKYGFPNAKSSMVLVHTYAFNLCTNTALIRQIGNECHLKDPDYLSSFVFNHGQFLVWVRIDSLKSIKIGFGQWDRIIFPFTAQCIICNHFYDGRHVLDGCFSKVHFNLFNELLLFNLYG